MSDQLGCASSEVFSEGSVADDVLNGVEDYAEFIGWKPRRCYYLLERGLLPGGKIGNRWIGSKRAVRVYLTKIASGSLA